MGVQCTAIINVNTYALYVCIRYIPYTCMNNHVHRAPFSDIERKKEVATYSMQYAVCSVLCPIEWVITV